MASQILVETLKNRRVVAPAQQKLDAKVLSWKDRDSAKAQAPQGDVTAAGFLMLAEEKKLGDKKFYKYITLSGSDALMHLEMNRNKFRVHHEVVFDKPQKMLFDIDVDREKFPSVNKDEVIQLLMDIIEAVYQFVGEEPENLGREVSIFDSSDEETKISFHLLFRKWTFRGSAVCDYIHEKVMEMIGEEYKDLIDHGIHSSSHNFRLKGSHKLDAPSRVKKLLKTWDWDSSYKYEPAFAQDNEERQWKDEYFAGTDPNLNGVIEMVDSFVQYRGWHEWYDLDCEIKEIVVPAEAKKERNADDLDEATKDAVLKLYEEKIPEHSLFKYRDTQGNIINLDRVQGRLPKPCSVCHEKHNSENPYLSVSGDNRSVFYNCRRVEKGKWIGKLGANDWVLPQTEEVWNAFIDYLSQDSDITDADYEFLAGAQKQMPTDGDDLQWLKKRFFDFISEDPKVMEELSNDPHEENLRKAKKLSELKQKAAAAKKVAAAEPPKVEAPKVTPPSKMSIPKPSAEQLAAEKGPEEEEEEMTIIEVKPIEEQFVMFREVLDEWKAAYTDKEDFKWNNCKEDWVQNGGDEQFITKFEKTYGSMVREMKSDNRLFDIALDTLTAGNVGAVAVYLMKNSLRWIDCNTAYLRDPYSGIWKKYPQKQLSTVHKVVANLLISKFNEYREVLGKKILSAGGPEKVKLETRDNNCVTLMNKLTNDKFPAAVAGQTKAEMAYGGLCDPDFENKLNGSVNWIAVKNQMDVVIMVNTKTGVIRPVTAKDNITNALDLRISEDWDKIRETEEYRQFDDAMSKIMGELFKDPAEREKTRVFQRSLGYILIKHNKAKAFFMWIGENGNNGKSWTADVLRNLLGMTYYKKVDQAVVVRGKQASEGSHTSHVMALKNKWVGISPELRDGAALNDNLIKDATGGDGLNGRSAYAADEEFFESFIKLIIMSNYVPKFDSTQSAMKERVNYIPFTSYFHSSVEADSDETRRYKADSTIVDNLRDNMGRWREVAFRWFLDGAMDFYNYGDKTAFYHPEFEAAKNAMLKDNDIFTQYTEARVVKSENGKIQSTEFYHDFLAWHKYVFDRNPNVSHKKFGEEMTKKFGEARKTNGTMQYIGIKLGV